MSRLIALTLGFIWLCFSPTAAETLDGVPLFTEREPVFNANLGRQLARLAPGDPQSAAKASTLIRRGANPDFVDHCTPLLADASGAGNLALVTVLLVEGDAEPNLIGCDGTGTAMTSLFKSWYDVDEAQERTNILRLLIAHGADPVLGTQGSGKSALHLAASHVARGAALRFLLNLGLDVDLVAQSSTPETPLSLATLLATLETMQTLLEHGAQFEPIDLGGRSTVSPLLAAIASQDSAKVELLLKLGADANVAGVTNVPGRMHAFQGRPLALASCLGDEEIVDALIKAKAELEEIHHPLFMTTALDIAALNGHLPIVDRLLEAGAVASERTQRNSCSREVLVRLCDGDLNEGSLACSFLSTKFSFPATCPASPQGCE